MNTELLKQTGLFDGLSERDLSEAARFLRASVRLYRRGEQILSAGDTTDSMGYVIKGSVRIESNDFWGNRTILGNAAAGQFFAETYAFLKDEVLLVDVTANEKCEILFLNVGGLDRPEIRSSPWRISLLQGLLKISAQKNLMLSRRSFHTAP